MTMTDEEYEAAVGDLDLDALDMMAAEVEEAIVDAVDRCSQPAAAIEPTDTLTGRMQGVVSLRETLRALRDQRVIDEQEAAIYAQKEAERLEALEAENAQKHYEEVGFGEWG